MQVNLNNASPQGRTKASKQNARKQAIINKVTKQASKLQKACIRSSKNAGKESAGRQASNRARMKVTNCETVGN